MLRVDSALFSNVVSAVQRTANLPGGSVRGLPGGTSVEGLRGVESFSADINDAQREYKLGRVHTALQRVRQVQMQFGSISSRWNGSITSLLSSARQGKQNLPLQKMNEVKNAQAKMLQLTNPAIKALRDLIMALEHAIAIGEDVEDGPHEEEASQDDGKSQDDGESRDDGKDAIAKSASNVVSSESSNPTTSMQARRDVASDASATVEGLLGRFAEKYRLGSQLQIELGSNGKRQLTPKLEVGRFYLFKGLSSPTVVRLRELHSNNLVVFDSNASKEREFDTVELQALLRSGIWVLETRQSASRAT